MDGNPGGLYFAALEKDFGAAWGERPKEYLESMQAKSEIQIDGPMTMAANFAEVDGTAHIFLANFGGLIPGKVAQPTPVENLRVEIPAGMGDSLMYLPFLGTEQMIKGKRNGEQVEFTLPAVERGAVVWVPKHP